MSKKKESRKSPHNSRLFSAVTFGLLLGFRWSLLMGLIVLNIVFLQDISKSTWWQQRLAILADPTSTLAHTKLAQMYWQDGQKAAARKEINLVEDLEYINHPENILGISSQSTDIPLDWQEETNRLVQAYSYWESVIKDKSDYRDAYVQLAYIAYLLKRDTEAQYYLNKLRYIDPTHNSTLDLVNYIKEK